MLLVLLVVMVVIGVTLRRHPVAAPRPTKRPAPRGVPVGRYKRTSAPAEDDADATSPPTTEKIVPEESGETVALVSATPVPTVDDAASTSLNDPYELRPAAVGSRVNAEFLRSRLCPPLWQLYSQSAIMPGSALALWMPALLPFFDEAVVADKAQPLPSSAEAGDADLHEGSNERITSSRERAGGGGVVGEYRPSSAHLTLSMLVSRATAVISITPDDVVTPTLKFLHVQLRRCVHDIIEAGHGATAAAKRKTFVSMREDTLERIRFAVLAFGSIRDFVTKFQDIRSGRIRVSKYIIITDNLQAAGQWNRNFRLIHGELSQLKRDKRSQIDIDVVLEHEHVGIAVLRITQQPPLTTPQQVDASSGASDQPAPTAAPTRAGDDALTDGLSDFDLLQRGVIDDTVVRALPNPAQAMEYAQLRRQLKRALEDSPAQVVSAPPGSSVPDPVLVGEAQRALSLLEDFLHRNGIRWKSMMADYRQSASAQQRDELEKKKRVAERQLRPDAGVRRKRPHAPETEDEEVATTAAPPPPEEPAEEPPPSTRRRPRKTPAPDDEEPATTAAADGASTANGDDSPPPTERRRRKRSRRDVDEEDAPSDPSPRAERRRGPPLRAARDEGGEPEEVDRPSTTRRRKRKVVADDVEGNAQQHERRRLLQLGDVGREDFGVAVKRPRVAKSDAAIERQLASRSCHEFFATCRTKGCNAALLCAVTKPVAGELQHHLDALHVVVSRYVLHEDTQVAEYLVAGILLLTGKREPAIEGGDSQELTPPPNFDDQGGVAERRHGIWSIGVTGCYPALVTMAATACSPGSAATCTKVLPVISGIAEPRSKIAGEASSSCSSVLKPILREAGVAALVEPFADAGVPASRFPNDAVQHIVTTAMLLSPSADRMGDEAAAKRRQAVVAAIAAAAPTETLQTILVMGTAIVSGFDSWPDNATAQTPQWVPPNGFFKSISFAGRPAWQDSAAPPRQGGEDAAAVPGQQDASAVRRRGDMGIGMTLYVRRPGSPPKE